jgi:perosamine synthetase
MSNDIPMAYPELGQAEKEAVNRVLASGRLSVGPELAAFEQGCADLAGAQGAVGVNSGTTGLQLILEALDIGPADEVITVSHTFVGTITAIIQAGAHPVLVDVEPASRNIDPAVIESAIGPRTRAIMPVHLFGRPANMSAILKSAERHGLAVIEDACEAIGSQHQNQPVGALGTAGVFAFYPNKPVAAGEGGMIVSRDTALLDRCRRLRNQGRDPNTGTWDTRPGHSARLSELHAAIGCVQLSRLDRDLDRRANIAAAYSEALTELDGVETPPLAGQGERIAWFTYPIRLPACNPQRRDLLMDGLKKDGIASSAYFQPVHWLPPYRDRFKGLSLPITEALGEQGLALPLYPSMTENTVGRVCWSLARHLNTPPA